MAINNSCHFIGRLTRDPHMEKIQTEKGDVSAVKFTLAVDNYRKSKDGQSIKEPAFVDCEVYDKAADYISTNFIKGDEVAVECYVKTNKWADKATGAPRSRNSYRVSEFKLLRKKRIDEVVPEETD